MRVLDGVQVADGGYTPTGRWLRWEIRYKSAPRRRCAMCRLLGGGR